MNKKIGKMNVPFSEVYDEADDVYYVTFKTGEPSYCEEIDDILIVEVGLFSNLPTGFRILNFKKNDVKSVKINMLFKKMQQSFRDINPPKLGDRESQVKKALQEVFCGK